MKRLIFWLMFPCVLPLSVTVRATPESQAEINALQERITDLQANEAVIRSTIRQVGGTDTTKQGIINANVQKRNLEEQHRDLEGVIDAYRRNHADLDQLRQQVANEPIITFSDLAQEAAKQPIENAVKEGLKNAGKTGASRAAGIISIIGNVVELGVRWEIRNWNTADIQAIVDAERTHLIDALRLSATLSYERNAEAHKIEQLQELERQFNANLDELARVQQRFDILTGNAHRHDANLDRDTDAAGDAAEERKQHTISVRPCGPNQRPTPFGVRTANKQSDVAEKITEKSTEKVIDDACKEITGFWTFTQTTQLGNREISTPPVRAEIALADNNTYEIFAASKAQATSGPFMKCSLADYALTCQRRAQPQNCPPEKYRWEPMNLAVAQDVSLISGEFVQTLTMDMSADPSGCTLTRFDGQGKMGYKFEPVKTTP